VCNLSYLQTDWYTDQMRRPAWNSPGLPITWNRWEYVDNMGHDVFYIKPQNETLQTLKAQLQTEGKNEDPFELKYIIDHFVRNKDYGYIPTDSIVMTVDKTAVLRSGMKLVAGPDSIPSKVTISLKGKRLLTKSEMMVYELLANHNWERPLYMSVTLGSDNYAGLDNNLLLEGLAYRVTPFNMGGRAIDADRMFDNMMHKFRYGNMAQRGLYLDESTMRMCYTHRSMFMQLIGQLLREGKKDKAAQALDKVEKVLPAYNIPYDYQSVGVDFDLGVFSLPEYMHQLGRDKDAERVLLDMAKTSTQYMAFYNSLGNRMDSYGSEIGRQFYYLTFIEKGLERCGSKELAKFRQTMNALEKSPAGQMWARQMMMQQRSMQQRTQGADGDPELVEE
ncbi:MAG: hypothetical protein HUK09_04970, partial [Bacteroidaceae bacterium]|nr:hypothetical protein [Bacteroidaceae bacterium]